MKMVKSHVFVTNEDLYSAYDKEVRMEESRVVRRLASQRSKGE